MEKQTATRNYSSGSQEKIAEALLRNNQKIMLARCTHPTSVLVHQTVVLYPEEPASPCLECIFRALEQVALNDDGPGKENLVRKASGKEELKKCHRYVFQPGSLSWYRERSVWLVTQSGNTPIP